MFVGFAAATMGAVGLALSPDPRWMVVRRGMSGGGAAAWVVFTVLYSSYFPPEKATKAMGYMTFISGMSQMISTYTGGMVAQRWGWTAPFYVAAGMGILGAVVAYPLVEQPVVFRRQTTLGQLVRTATVPLLLTVSFVAMMSSWHQWTTANGFTLVYAADLGASRADLGALTALMQAAYTVTPLISAYLSDRVSMRAIVAGGMGVQAIAAVMVPQVHSVPLVGFSQFLTGAGRGFAFPILMGLSIRAVPAQDRATAMGVFQAVYAVGMFLGPATTGFLADSFGISSVFWVAGIACLAGVFISLWGVPAK